MVLDYDYDSSDFRDVHFTSFMTLAQFEVVAEPPMPKKSTVKQILFFLLTDIVVPILIILLFNAVGLAFCTGAFVLVHNFEFSKPFGQSESATQPRGFVIPMVLLILVHCIAVAFNGYRGIYHWVWEKASSKQVRRIVYIAGWLLMAALWFVSMIVTAEDNFDDNLFGFKEKVQ